MEGKIGDNSENLAFKMILSDIRRKKLVELAQKLRANEGQSSHIQDEITTPYSKIVKTILPNADFDWRNDKTYNTR